MTTAQTLIHTLPAPPRLLCGKGDQAIARLACDSRLCDEHTLFVCIRGAAADGHSFVRSAFARGCRAFLVEDESVMVPEGASVYLSDDTRRDLALLSAALYAHPWRGMRLVGITGTKGKTSVALMCYHILQKNGHAVGYIGTNGAWYGELRQETGNTTPGPLELHAILADMRREGIETVLLEVSSQALWQKRVYGLPFAVCALTNLYPDHIGTSEHPSMEHYAACKRSLLTDYGAPIIVANTDDASAQAMLCGASGRIVACSTEQSADLFAENIRDTSRGALPVTEFVCRDSAGGAYGLSLPLIGKHNVSNALLSLAIARALGVSPDRAAKSLSDVTIPGRFELIEHRGALIVIDYAHNGASLRAALSSLRPRTRGRLLCLVGSIGERTQCRRAELGEAADELADFTYLTADDPGHERVEDICRDMIAAFKPRFLPNYTVIVDRAEAIRAAMNELREGDVLLLAGKGDERTQRIGGQSLPHRDRDVVESYIRADKLMLS